MKNTYRECCEYILDIPKFAAKNTLKDTHKILEEVYLEGSSKIIHIAGTNGKGSTTEYICSILMSMGYKVGMFTSPHLVDMTERISVDGKNISEEEFINSFNNIINAVQRKKEVNHPSFFEFLFLMAMDYFARMKTEIIVLETGLGGRLDATNCILDKDLCVITKIGMDHMEYLGDTLEEIAGEKAGIIKENVPVVYWDNEDESSLIIKKRIMDSSSKGYPVNKNSIEAIDLTKRGIDFSYRCGYYYLCDLHLNTQASYQTENASLAVMAIFALKPYLFFDEKIIKQGLLSAFWAGRMEEISRGIFLDGAHNTDGVMALVNSIYLMENSNKAYRPKRRILVFSAVKDKEYSKMIDIIVNSKLFSLVYLTHIDSQRGTDIVELSACFEGKDGVEIRLCDDALLAFEKAKEEKQDDDELFVAGSLYLIGEIKGALT